MLASGSLPGTKIMEWSTEHDSVTREEYIAVDTRGEPLLRDPFTNNSTASVSTVARVLGIQLPSSSSVL
jgi:hypothetical protein